MQEPIMWRPCGFRYMPIAEFEGLISLTVCTLRMNSLPSSSSSCQPRNKFSRQSALIVSGAVSEQLRTSQLRFMGLKSWPEDEAED